MPSLATEALTNTLKAKARELGFYRCGIAEARRLEEDAGRLEDWLRAGRQGEMKYMENYFDKRTDPTRLLPGARSMIVVLQNYYPAVPLGDAGGLKISRYAYGTDYHFTMKRKLKDLAAFTTQHAPGSNARVFVDSAPVLERSWAREAGLGWIGKNTCLITKEQGSYFFIGIVLTDAELSYDDHREPNHCGGCTRCLEACPTGALDRTGLDARKCISYLTIEYRGEHLPVEYSGKMENWIFGCDTCQEVCPWNRLSEPHAEPEFLPKEELGKMDMKAWKTMGEERFRELFKRSPVKRTGYRGLRRNILFLLNAQKD
jgi:epoxyqueuosine reductase